MPDETSHQLGYKHRRDHHGGVDNAERYDAHAFHLVQGALQTIEAEHGSEDEEEREGDDDDVLPDSALLSSGILCRRGRHNFHVCVHLKPGVDLGFVVSGLARRDLETLSFATYLYRRNNKLNCRRENARRTVSQATENVLIYCVLG